MLQTKHNLIPLGPFFLTFSRPSLPPFLCSSPYPLSLLLPVFTAKNNILSYLLETKTLKKLVRDIIDPSRNLGHVDRPKARDLVNLTPSGSVTTTSVDSTLAPRSEIHGQLGSGANETQKNQREAEEADSRPRSSKKVCEECP